MFFAPQKDPKPVVPLGGEPFPRMGFQKAETRSSVTPGTLIGEGLEMILDVKGNPDK